MLFRTSAARDRRIRGEASIALTCGSAVLGAAVARLAVPDVPAVAWLLAPMLGLVGLLGALRRPGPDGDATTVWVALGGALIAIPAAFCAASDPWVCGALFAATPAGLLLYGTWLVLLGRLRGLDVTPTCEDGDLAAIHAGRWLLGVSLATGWVALVRLDPLAGWLAAATAVVGALRWAAGAIGRRERRRWIAAVRRGRVPGLAIVPRRTLGTARTSDLPVLARRTPCTEVLVEPSASGPYRDAVGAPVAVVPAANAWRAPVPWQAPSAVARGAAALVGALFAPFLGLAIGVVSATACAPAPSAALAPGVLVGWTLLVSGPATGLLVGALAKVAPPVRGTTLAVSLAAYCLGAPMLCVAVATAAGGL